MMSLSYTPPQRPALPAPAVSAAAAVAVSALRAIRTVTFDKRAFQIADRTLRELGDPV